MKRERSVHPQAVRSVRPASKRAWNALVVTIAASFVGQTSGSQLRGKLPDLFDVPSHLPNFSGSTIFGYVASDFVGSCYLASKQAKREEVSPQKLRLIMEMTSHSGFGFEFSVRNKNGFEDCPPYFQGHTGSNRFRLRNDGRCRRGSHAED